MVKVCGLLETLPWDYAASLGPQVSTVRTGFAPAVAPTCDVRRAGSGGTDQEKLDNVHARQTSFYSITKAYFRVHVQRMCMCACVAAPSLPLAARDNMSARRHPAPRCVRPAGTGDASHTATRLRRKKGEGGGGRSQIARPSQTLRMAASSVASTGLLSWRALFGLK